MHKITCNPIINMFGKKTGKYKASFGSFSEEGDSKQEASDKLNNALDWYLLDIDLPTKIKQTQKRIFFLERSFYGYSINYIWIGYKESYPSSSLLGRVSELKANELFENYINQMVECTDDSFL